MAAADDVEEVADDGAGGRSDDADGARKHGQRLFAVGVEEAFGFEPLLELLKGKLQRARADRFHGFGDQLQLAALLVNADAAADQHVQAILRAKAEKHRLAAEENDGKLGVGVLQREIDVAGGRGPEVRNLAFDPDVAVLLLDKLAHLSDQIANGPDAPCRASASNRSPNCNVGSRSDANGSCGITADECNGWGQRAITPCNLRRCGRGRPHDSRAGPGAT